MEFKPSDRIPIRPSFEPEYDQNPQIRIRIPDFRQWSEHRSVGTRGGEGRGVADAQGEAWSTRTAERFFPWTSLLHPLEKDKSQSQWNFISKSDKSTYQRLAHSLSEPPLDNQSSRRPYNQEWAIENLDQPWPLDLEPPRSRPDGIYILEPGPF